MKIKIQENIILNLNNWIFFLLNIEIMAKNHIYVKLHVGPIRTIHIIHN